MGISTEERPDVSVVIPTFRRPEFLRRAVESVLAQRGVSESFEIIVVDNDGSASARVVVDELAADSARPIRYVNEPRPGISHARNTGVTAAVGRSLAFLDDDEAASPDWLASLLDTANRFSADIVVGPVRPIFPAATAVSAYAREVYTRDAGLPSGSVIDWGGIGNALLRKDRCFRTATPFDPRLGLTGGEDSVFLRQLIQDGRKLVWCADAAVTETVLADKLTPRYLLRRAFRAGQTTSFQPSALAPPQWLAVIRWMAIGTTQAIVLGPLGLLLQMAGHPISLPVLAKAASGLGKLLWHPSLHIRNYRLARSNGNAREG
jgi:hypothetical protein